MIIPLLKTHINSRASYLSHADYKNIMQYRDMKPKPLAQLSKKYKISNSRLYQIWRGQEFNRIQWNDIVVPLSTNVIDKQNEVERADFQNKYDSTIIALENVMRDAEVKPSKSTNPTSEEDSILGSKAKKTRGSVKPKEKSKSKGGLPPLIPSPTQTQPIPTSHEKIDERNIKNLTNIKNILEK